MTRSPLRQVLAAALFVSAFGAPLVAQQPGLQRPAILVFDRDRVMRDSAPARALAAEERSAQLARRDEMNELRAELEAEEAEITALRESAERELFEARAAAFKARVREERRASHSEAQAILKRFADARQLLAEALGPILREVLAETGASIILDARTVVAASPGADITEDVIRRFNLRAADIPLPPAPAAEPAGSTLAPEDG